MSFDKISLENAVREALKAVLRPDGSVESLNETETRTHLIDPVVRALGYDGLDRVRREHRLSSGQFVDYLLFAGAQRVAIEAKQVRTELGGKDAGQLVGYCAPEGVRWAILTDGLRWQVFDVGAPGDWAAKKVEEVDLLAAHKRQSLGEALEPLAHFAFDALASGDSALARRSDEKRARALLDRILSDPASAVVQAAVEELKKAGVNADAGKVVGWLQARAGRAPQTAAQPEAKLPRVSSGAPNYYVFPVAGTGGHTAREVLKCWLDAGCWGVGKASAHRARLAAGDRCCFYTKGEGVVAEATLAGPAKDPVSPTEWPEPRAFHPGIYKVSLVNIRWLTTPVGLSAEVRASLDAFHGKDPRRPWGWFVQSTSRITEHDFRILAGETA